VSTSTRVSIGMSFWGIDCHIDVQSEDDADFLTHVFRSFLVHQVDAAHAVELATEPPAQGFIASIGNERVEKIVRTKAPGQAWVDYERFRYRARRLSPVPPFQTEAFRSRFTLLHGASLATPDGRGIALLGRSLAGKSTLTLELLRRGWRLLSDDLTVVDHAADVPACLRRFDRPVGIRERTRRQLGWLDTLPAVGAAANVMTATGLTTVVHADEMFPGCLVDRVRLARAFVLCGDARRAPATAVPAASLDDFVVTSPLVGSSALDGLIADRFTFDLDDAVAAAAWLDNEVAAP